MLRCPWCWSLLLLVLLRPAWVLRRLSFKYRRGSSATIHSHRPRGVTELSPVRLVPTVRHRDGAGGAGRGGDAGVLRWLGGKPLVLRRWWRGCCSLPLHVEARFRSSAKSVTTRYTVFLFLIYLFYLYHRLHRSSRPPLRVQTLFQTVTCFPKRLFMPFFRCQLCNFAVDERKILHWFEQSFI